MLIPSRASGLTPFRQQLRERAEAARARRQGDRSTERDGQDDERCALPLRHMC